MGLPIDFEEKVKQPPAVGGVGGYPYSISAKHLMQNFVYASPVIPLTGENGLNGITEVVKTGPGGHKSRELSTTPLDPGETAGDMLYWDGTAWVPIAGPSGMSEPVLSHDGTTPSWIENPASSGVDLNVTIYRYQLDGDLNPILLDGANKMLFFRSGSLVAIADSGSPEESAQTVPSGLQYQNLADILPI